MKLNREGLSTRQVGGSDEIQLRIDPIHGDFDEEITGLRKQVRQLRNVSFSFIFFKIIVTSDLFSIFFGSLGYFRVVN